MGQMKKDVLFLKPILLPRSKITSFHSKLKKTLKAMGEDSLKLSQKVGP